jgi:hypothetical protein
MSNLRYIEIDSTYRNRELWPHPAQFEIDISQTGSRNKDNALDPVSLAAPGKVWKSNQFNTNCMATVPTCPPSPLPEPNSASIRVRVETSNPALPDVGSTSAGQTFIIIACLGYNLQKIANYYQGAVASTLGISLTSTCCTGCEGPADPTVVKRRILFYKYLGTINCQDGNGNFLCCDRAQITLTDSLGDDIFKDNLLLEITDPTDFSDICNPLLFVPAGRIGSNAYPFCILYNETRKSSRKITGYDAITHLLTINTGPDDCNAYSKCNIPPKANTTNDCTCACDNEMIIKVPCPTCINPTSNICYSGTGCDPTDWLPTDVYSIRDDLPMVTGMVAPTGFCDYTCYPPTQFNSYPPTRFNSARVNCYQPKETPCTGTKEYYLNKCTIPLDKNNSYLSNCDDFYNNQFIRIIPPLIPTIECPNPLLEPYSCCQIKRISKYIGNCKTIILCDCLDNDPLPGSMFEILPFSYDNAVPFSYSGSLVSQQEEVCYEISLINLILPNATLAVGQGSRIAFYPYVYVELTNLSGGMKNIIYSNNPNSSRMLFRCPVTDVNNPDNTNFIDLGSDMKQTVKFKPNDNLRFSVILQNGELYKTVLQENFSPCAPNLQCQISAVFAIRRL